MLGIFLGPERDCKYVDAPGCPTGLNLFCTPYIYITYICVFLSNVHKERNLGKFDTLKLIICFKSL